MTPHDWFAGCCAEIVILDAVIMWMWNTLITQTYIMLHWMKQNWLKKVIRCLKSKWFRCFIDNPEDLSESNFIYPKKGTRQLFIKSFLHNFCWLGSFCVVHGTKLFSDSTFTVEVSMSVHVSGVTQHPVQGQLRETPVRHESELDEECLWPKRIKLSDDEWKCGETGTRKTAYFTFT